MELHRDIRCVTYNGNTTAREANTYENVCRVTVFDWFQTLQQAN